MSTSVVYQGAVAPESIQITITQGDSGLDLTTVSAVEFDLRQPDGTAAVWSATILSATATTLIAYHTFLFSDTAQLGDFALLAKMTVPGGFRRTVPTTITVLDPFDNG